MTSVEPIMLIDRTGAEIDDRCKQEFYWNRLYKNKGIVKKEEALALTVGRETHEDLYHIANMPDIRADALEELIQDFLRPLSEEDRKNTRAMELLYRRLGWMVAWALYVEPKIRERYETIGIEKEIILDRTPLWIPVTPDRVLMDRGNRNIEYREYKTTVTANQKWLQSWHYAIQLHIGMAAIEEEINKIVSFSHIVALMKGDKDEFGRLRHPYVWSYYNTNSDKWETDGRKTRGADWVLLPVWESNMSIVKFVQMLGEDVGKSQFPHSPPVFLNKRMLDQWVAARTHRMRQIRGVKDASGFNENIRNLHFPKTLSRCRPGFGDLCPFIQACWNESINRDPVGSGLYVERTPHHEVEIVGVQDWKKNGKDS